MPGQPKRPHPKTTAGVNKKLKAFNQLTCLSQEEQENPAEVLEAFFENYHLKEIKEYLWDWLVAALSSNNGTYQTGEARSNLLFFYENIETLAEAIFLLHQKNMESNTSRKK